MKTFYLFVVLAVLCTLAACSRQVSLPRPSGEVLSGLEKQQALENCRQSALQVKSFRALSRTRIEHDEDRTTLRQVVVFASAAKFRIEALPLNGAYTLSLVIANDGKLLALDPEEKTARQAPLNSGLLRQVLHIPLNEVDLMPLLAGRVPSRLLNEESAEFSRDPASDRLYFTLAAGQAFFEAASGSCLLKSAEFRDPFSDKTSLRITYGEACLVDGLEVPCQIGVENVSDGLSSDLAFSNFSVNREYPEDLFRQEIPPDFRIME